ncbi:excise, DNA binding domain, excisionase family [uncultured Caudovirales phage]|uniref:Excise, DNA binding domain, excisionase family n=1 Tax=uncultured Caudovirales phage TaxID=2100421 RepID=A0A6J5RRR5_9CAUD|nr:excise, DNA binding domain, excisionase family [uncultured Caudovirales phage]
MTTSMTLLEPRLLFSPQEVASLINRGRTFVHAEIAAGHLRSFKHGRCRRIHRDALLEYVANIQKSDGSGT